MALAVEFNQLNNKEHIFVLETAFNKAKTFILEYIDNQKIEDTSAFYKWAESYGKIIEYYTSKK